MDNSVSISKGQNQVIGFGPVSDNRKAEIGGLREENHKFETSLLDSYTKSEYDQAEMNQAKFFKNESEKREPVCEKKAFSIGSVLAAASGLAVGFAISKIQENMEQSTKIKILKKPGFSINFYKNINKRDNEGKISLHKAMNKAQAEKLIKRGADVNARDKNGFTPLFDACEYGRLDVADILISNGADINAKEYNYGKSPLFVACFNGNQIFKDVIELLVSKGADVNIRDDKGRTVLWHLAESRAYNAGIADNRRVVIADFLREHGAVE